MKKITPPVQQDDISLGMISTVLTFMTKTCFDGEFYLPITLSGLQLCHSETCLCMNSRALVMVFLNKNVVWDETEEERRQRFADYKSNNFRRASYWEILKYGFYYISKATKKASHYNAMEPELCAQYIASLSPAEETDLTAFRDLKSLREHFGLSKAKFCRHLGVAYKTYEKWESGDRTPPPYQFAWIVSYLAQNPPT